MIDLNTTTDYVHMLLVAAGVGAIGGLGAELLLKRADTTGTLMLPAKMRNKHLLELGFVSSLLLGAIASVAILYFFPPVTTTVTPGPNGTTVTTHQYDLVKLVALALIVGSAGPAFLSTTQTRLQSALNAQKVDTAVETGKNQLEQIAESAKAAVPAAVRSAVSAHMASADPAQLTAVADAATASLQSALEPQLAVARQQVEAVGQ